jgi:hypothetical protein
LVAADLLSVDHPLAGVFAAFRGDNHPTKRQAAKFLAAHPQYRGVAKAA